MHIRNRRQYFSDVLVDFVGIRSGLVVGTDELPRLLVSNGHADYLALVEGDNEEGLRVNVGDLQNAFIALLHAVGAIPDPRPVEQLFVDFSCAHEDLFAEEELGLDFLSLKLHRLAQFVSHHVLAYTIDGAELPDSLRNAPDIGFIVDQTRRRHLLSSLPESRFWNGTIDLGSLFGSEDLVAPPGSYFDQRYIDYLRAQEKDITRIHWRKFEHLTAEFFQRSGYAVTLGPGRDDGGKDVVAVKQDAITGPDKVLVQCRRLGEDPVGVDAVRAFWATVGDENATKGVFATTTRLTQGASEYCEARRYRLSKAEGEHVKAWLRSMATHYEKARKI